MAAADIQRQDMLSMTLAQHLGPPPDAAMATPAEMPRVAVRSREAEERIRRMVDEHFDFIWRCLRGLGVSPGSADDATQHVFWIATQKLDDIAHGSERSFLFATARGVAANVRRSQGRNRELLDAEALAKGVDGAADPEQELVKKQARAALESILEALPVDLRTVFVLFELEGLGSAAIAELLEIPAGTVASRLRRAREEFHAEVKRYRAREGRRS